MHITASPAVSSASFGDCGLGSARACSSEEPPVEKFIQRENVTLYKKRLAEPQTDGERKIILKLLADEEAKDAPSSPKS
jgi:hypothetical protein